LVALPEPEDIPGDERAREFVAHLAYLKANDVEYLIKLEALRGEGRDDEFEVAKLDRWLRDKTRVELGLSPRPNRKELDLKQHARDHDIDPSIELGSSVKKSGSRSRKLQTLLLPENLESRLESIQDLARLSKQEMGLSTLFVAFGFVEWYQSDSSEKAAFAPLLLLPVQLRERKADGRKVFSLVAEDEAPETNITLVKYLADKIGRDLPVFENDEDQPSPVEMYFSEVERAIDGLQRWKVRRFVTLGHFSFGRLAMYQDLDPAGAIRTPLPILSCKASCGESNVRRMTEVATVSPACRKTTTSTIPRSKNGHHFWCTTPTLHNTAPSWMSSRVSISLSRDLPALARVRPSRTL